MWFVVYVIAKRISNRSRVPSPYWWLVIAACNNLFMVVYTMYLIGSGTLHTPPPHHTGMDNYYIVYASEHVCESRPIVVAALQRLI